MNKDPFRNENGDTNIISLLVILSVALALALLFRSYAADLVASLF